ncbi:MAG: GNAT family N-acetyltransferase [Actinomycetes bacterium]
MIRISEWILKEPDLLEIFVTWRRHSREKFFARFAESRPSMERYLRGVCQDPFRVLFLIEDQNLLPLGHIGLKALDSSTPEIDAVMVNPNARAKGVMSWALEQCVLSLGSLAHVSNVKLDVLSNNEQAISLYRKCGFVHASSRSLRLVQGEGFEVLTPCDPEDSDISIRAVTMTRELEHASKQVVD